MKNRILVRILCGYMMLSAISCEEMLETELPQNQIPAGPVFDNIQTANATLAALYAGLYDNSPLAGDQTGRLLGVYTDDLAFFSPAATNGVPELYQNLHADSNPSILTYWTNAYQKIYVTNAIIEGVDQSTGISNADKKRIKGEALLVRSLLLFMLEEIFGDVPYPDSTDYIVNSSLSRTSRATVLQRLETDVTEAEALLEDTYINAERIYPNRQVATLLRAMVYLSQSRWSDAESILKSILSHPLYTFQNDITKVFIKTGPHILWQLKPKNQGDGTKEALLYFFSSTPTSYALSTSLVNTLSGDLRKQHWTATVNAAGNTWYRAEKYKNRSSNTTEYSIVFRLEEVYLMLAECLMQQNKTSEAIPYVNATRTRAGLSPLLSPVSSEDLKNEILNEYRKEFFAERGIRFFTLKRMDKINSLSVTKANWKTAHHLWPIPQKELLLNPNLHPQNPGY